MAKKQNKRLNPHYFLLLAVSAIIAISLPHIGIFKSNLPCANSISCVKDLSGKYEDESFGTFMGRSVKVPQNLAQAGEKAVLGENSSANKHIYVDLSSQKLYAYENNNLILEFPVSTGKWGPTPTGDFNIWIKLRYTRMTGGDPAIGTFYDLPNVPYTMFYSNSEVPRSAGYSLHGAYWHNNFGHPMSHGCVNISPANAEKLYYWANPVTLGSITYATNNDPGTPITIYGTPPSE